MSKYHNLKTEVNGIVFDSKREAERYRQLLLMIKVGLIKDLKRQVKYCLIPTIEGEGRKVRQRAVYYIADFTYYEKDGDRWSRVVEDVKGVKTDVYKLKKKLMLWRYGIEIREV